MKITGTVEYIIYENSANGYTVFSIETEDGLITCTGNTFGLGMGETIELTGDINYHPKYGEQFLFTDIKRTIPTTKSGVLNYLKSGNLPHIGEKMAVRIYEKFKEETANILEEDPDRLIEVSGISHKKLEKIKEALIKGSESRAIILQLAELEIYGNDAYKIYNVYGNDSYSRVKEDPYKLAREVSGFGFIKADNIAMKLGIPKDDIRRLKGAMLYILEDARNNGHVYLREEDLLEGLKRLIIPKEEDVPIAITDLIRETAIIRKSVDGEILIYLTGVYQLEITSSQLTANLIENKSILRENTETAIEKYLKNSDKTFDKEQIDAIEMALQNNFSIITGGPGTGKTTIIHAILTIAKDIGLKVKLAAPTGRAAKRMEEATGNPSHTLHRLLSLRPMGEDNYDLLTDEVDADLIIVDEASMIDTLLYGNLLYALKKNTALVLVGDKDQLPSVGAGNVLKDLLSIEEIPHVMLKNIHRTLDTSHIAITSKNIREGIVPNFNEKNSDVFFMEETDEDEFIENLLDVIENRLPRYYGFSPVTDIQILVPTKKGRLGTEELNTIIQSRINKEKAHIKHKNNVFKLGDKVMQISNNYEREIRYKTKLKDNEKGVFNGDIGIITDVRKNSIEVLFSDDYYATYEREELDELRLSYAITVHKSQGSEFPAIIFIAWKSNYLLNNRNLLYTGVSRAKELLVVMGSKKTFMDMLKNTHVQNRNTTLRHWIKERLSFNEKMHDM